MLNDSLKNERRPLALSTADRLILANQYAILAALFPDLRAEYGEKQHLVASDVPEEQQHLLPHEASVLSTSSSGVRAPRRTSTARVGRGGALTPW